MIEPAIALTFVQTPPATAASEGPRGARQLKNPPTPLLHSLKEQATANCELLAHVIYHLYALLSRAGRRLVRTQLLKCLDQSAWLVSPVLAEIRGAVVPVPSLALRPEHPLFARQGEQQATNHRRCERFVEMRLPMLL
jgi:hypothetical protein